MTAITQAPVAGDTSLLVEDTSLFLPASGTIYIFRNSFTYSSKTSTSFVLASPFPSTLSQSITGGILAGDIVTNFYLDVSDPRLVPTWDNEMLTYRGHAWQMLVYAFGYVMTDNPKYAEEAKVFINFMLNNVPRWGTDTAAGDWSQGKYYDKDLVAAENLANISTSLDLIYNYLAQVSPETKTKLVKDFARRASHLGYAQLPDWENTSDPRMGRTPYWSYEVGKNGVLGNHAIRVHGALLMASLFLEGEDLSGINWTQGLNDPSTTPYVNDSRWKDPAFWRQSMTDELNKTMQARDGEGTDPEGTRMFWPTAINYLFAHTAKTALGDDYFAKTTWWKNLGYWLLYRQFNNATRMASYGDGQYTEPFYSWLFKIAAEYQDSTIQWVAQKNFDYYYAQDSPLSFNQTVSKGGQIPYNYLLAFLYYNPSLQPSAPEPATTPTSRYFQDYFNPVLRSGWNPQDLVLSFRSGPPFMKERDDLVNSGLLTVGYYMGHVHADANSFQLGYGGEYFALDGATSTSDGYRETKYHNSILVNDLGQHEVYSDSGNAPWDDNFYQDLSHRPKILAFDDGQNYAYTVGDATGGYAIKTPLAKFTRSIVLLKDQQKTVIFDRLNTSSASTFKWLMHTGADVTRSGDKITLTKNNVNLYLDVLDPAGFNYATTSEETVNYGDTDKTSTLISLSNSASASQLNFLTAFSPDSNLLTQKIASADGKMMGTQMTGAVVLFGKDGQVSSPITYTVDGTGSSRQVIADLPANTTYTITDNGAPLSGSFVSSSQGVLTFDLNLGSSHTLVLTPGGERANNPPVLAPIGNKSVNEASLLEFQISATDPDGDSLTYSANNLPQGSTFNASTQTFSWTPGSNQAGSYNITFTVDDGKGGTDSETITITVNAPSAGTLSLNLRLQGRSSYTTTGTGLKIYQSGQSIVAAEWQDLTTNAGGTTTVSLTGLSPGSYDFQVKVNGFLSVKMTNQTFSDTLTLDFGILKAGDLNNDNIVNTADFALLNGKWNQADPSADINQDGITNTIDFALLNANWFSQGS